MLAILLFILFSYVFYSSRKSRTLLLTISFLLLARLSLAILLFDYHGLPDSGDDALTYLSQSQSYSHLPLPVLVQQFSLSSTKFYPFLHAVLTFGAFPSRTTAIILSVVSSILCLLVVYRFSYLLTGNSKISCRILLLVGLAPDQILYSILPIKEAMISFFLCTFIFSCVAYARLHQARHLFLIVISSLFLLGLHGGLIILLLSFTAFHIYKSFPRLLSSGRTNLMLLVLFIAIIYLIPPFLTGAISIPKLGYISQLSLETAISRFSRSSFGGSAYPGWLLDTNMLLQPLLVPLRILYFFFSPFIWDIRNPRQLLGLIPVTYTIYVTYLCLANASRSKYLCKMGILIVLPAIIVFSLSTTNIGTAVRHRAKFIPVLTVLFLATKDSILLRRQLFRLP